MKQDIAINIEYWGVQEEGKRLWELEGIDEFQAELRESYIARISGRPGPLGGGLYEFAIHVITDITLVDVLKWVASGIAFDILKMGTKSFFLRPLLDAYKKIRDKNKDHDVDIEELRFFFQDSELIITNLTGDSIYNNLGAIFKSLSENADHLVGRNGERPYTIQIPVFEDPDQQLCRFRVLLNVDETISSISDSNYFDYWGLQYDYEGTSRVYDVKRKHLIDSDYLTSNRYRDAWDKYHNGHSSS